MKAKMFLLGLMLQFCFMSVAQQPATLPQSAQPLTGVMPQTQSGQVIQDMDFNQAVVSANGEIEPLPGRNELTADGLFDRLFDPLYSGLFILLTYISYFIPGINKIRDTLARAVTIGLILLVGFLFFGAPFWKLAISYLISSGTYSYFLKAIFRTPKVATE